MNVFLSWSGEHSHDVAKAFSDWLPQVINALKPWISSEDIKKGTRWFEEIGSTLSESNAGIIFVTSENYTAPWLNFEAGALSKSLDKSRVIPFLVDLSNSDLVGPLTNFNTVSNTKPETFKLLKSLNETLDDSQKRDTSKLAEAFEVWWPNLEKKLEDISRLKPTKDRKVKKRPQEEVLEEILKLVRSIHSNNSQNNLNSSSNQNSLHAQNSRGLIKLSKLALDVGTTTERLIEQFLDAGIHFSSGEDLVDEEQKKSLLENLSKARSSNIDPVTARIMARRGMPFPPKM